MDYNFLSRVLWVVSIGIVTCGSISIILKGYGRKNLLLLFYLSAILLLEGISYYYSEYNSRQLNIFLFHLSGFVHFFFITLCYYYYFDRGKKLVYILVLSIGFILLLVNSTAYNGTETFHLYTNVLYNLAVVALSFLYFIGIVINGIRPQKFELFFNSIVLIYFSYDAIISLSSNFLINEHLDLVAPFWLFRTLLLQLFYVSLINFAWQTGKILK
jgi:hypothetical protein